MLHEIFIMQPCPFKKNLEGVGDGKDSRKLMTAAVHIKCPSTHLHR